MFLSRSCCISYNCSMWASHAFFLSYKIKQSVIVIPVTFVSRWGTLISSSSSSVQGSVFRRMDALWWSFLEWVVELHIPVRTGGSFYFPWRRHQIEWTDGFCLLRKTLAKRSKRNCQSSEAKLPQRDSNPAGNRPVAISVAVALAALFSLSDSLLTILCSMYISTYCTLSYCQINVFLPSLLHC